MLSCEDAPGGLAVSPPPNMQNNSSDLLPAASLQAARAACPFAPVGVEKKPPRRTLQVNPGPYRCLSRAGFAGLPSVTASFVVGAVFVPHQPVPLACGQFS